MDGNMLYNQKTWAWDSDLPLNNSLGNSPKPFQIYLLPPQSEDNTTYIIMLF